MAWVVVKICKDFATIWATIDPIGHPVPVRAANAFRATGFQPRIARAGARPGGVSAGGAFHRGTGRDNGGDPAFRKPLFYLARRKGGRRRPLCGAVGVPQFSSLFSLLFSAPYAPPPLTTL